MWKRGHLLHSLSSPVSALTTLLGHACFLHPIKAAWYSVYLGWHEGEIRALGPMPGLNTGLLTIWVILGKLLSLSVPLFPYL